ncbi:MAG: DinB family protein [Chloroflexota bacterium]
MDAPTIRPAYSAWPDLNDRLIEALRGLTIDQLAFTSGPDHWPLWAVAGHLACQRVFWLCDFAGEPGAETTPFTDAAHLCPGDDDLDHPFDGPALAAALTSTFRIVEAFLDRWTLADLGETIRRPDYGPDWVKTRGNVIQRVHQHDIAHLHEIDDLLAAQGLPRMQLWP